MCIQYICVCLFVWWSNNYSDDSRFIVKTTVILFGGNNVINDRLSVSTCRPEQQYARLWKLFQRSIRFKLWAVVFVYFFILDFKCCYRLRLIFKINIIDNCQQKFCNDTKHLHFVFSKASHFNGVMLLSSLPFGRSVPYVYSIIINLRISPHQGMFIVFHLLP